MIPADPGYLARVRNSFARQGVMHTLGATLDTVEAGLVVITMYHRPEFTQQHGFLHAGILSTGLDTACGYAAFSLMPADAAVLTVEFKVNLVAPARGPWFRFEGRVIKAGRTISVVDGRALQHEPGASAQTLVATMSATVMTVRGREGIHH
jgi:uncharacterized protein (TIGR00369 family)